MGSEAGEGLEGMYDEEGGKDEGRIERGRERRLRGIVKGRGAEARDSVFRWCGAVWFGVGWGGEEGMK